MTADEIAEVADFFSYGSNDLTQMSFGYSRDDIGSILPTDLEKSRTTVRRRVRLQARRLRCAQLERGL